MRARQDHQAGTGRRGAAPARWRGGAVVVAAAALSLVAGAVPASAAVGYTVTATIAVGSSPYGVTADPAAGTVYVANATIAVGVSGQPVSFSTGNTPLCTPDTSTTGVATCTLTAAQTLLAENDHDPIQASYPGTANYQPSSATMTPP
jgi:DNA-binding beta-propeller fold protein YncE